MAQAAEGFQRGPPEAVAWREGFPFLVFGRGLGGFRGCCGMSVFKQGETRGRTASHSLKTWMGRGDDGDG